MIDFPEHRDTVEERQLDAEMLAREDANEEGVAAELRAEPKIRALVRDDRPQTWTVDEIRTEALDRIKSYVASLDAETDSALIEELNEVGEDIDDDDFETDTQGVHLLALLLGVKVASPTG